MTPTPRSLAPALLPMLLAAAGCASSQAEVAPAPQPVRAPTYSVVGLEGVIGRTAHMVEGQFGRPELDVREGPARKLQFIGPACVLDVYLYPPRGGGDPIVTHVDARLPDGRDFDRASCVAALARKTQER